MGPGVCICPPDPSWLQLCCQCMEALAGQCEMRNRPEGLVWGGRGGAGPGSESEEPTPHQETVIALGDLSHPCSRHGEALPRQIYLEFSAL